MTWSAGHDIAKTQRRRWRQRGIGKVIVACLGRSTSAPSRPQVAREADVARNRHEGAKVTSAKSRNL